MKSRLRRSAAILITAISLTACSWHGNRFSATVDAEKSSALRHAIAGRSVHVQVEGEGVVIKVLGDDLDGDRHQRFIIRIPSGETLLVAHNIDEATRVDSLQEGDKIEFSGEYEWNDRGGVIHWTHNDRRGRHAGGWLKHHGTKYE
jgi:hypothetical protein